MKFKPIRENTYKKIIKESEGTFYHLLSPANSNQIITFEPTVEDEIGYHSRLVLIWVTDITYLKRPYINLSCIFRYEITEKQNAPEVNKMHALINESYEQFILQLNKAVKEIKSKEYFMDSDSLDFYTAQLKKVLEQ